MSERASGIAGGIEYFDVGDNRWEAQCARCGSSVETITCYNCGGDGFVESDDWEDQMFDDCIEPCHACQGEASSLHCISDPDWCQAHPLPGREQVRSTALSAEAWRDAL